MEVNIKENPRNKRTREEEYRYFDEELYKKQTKVEHANACKALLIKFETKVFTWMALQWLCFIALFNRN